MSKLGGIFFLCGFWHQGFKGLPQCLGQWHHNVTALRRGQWQHRMLWHHLRILPRRRGAALVSCILSFWSSEASKGLGCVQLRFILGRTRQEVTRWSLGTVMCPSGMALKACVPQAPPKSCLCLSRISSICHVDNWEVVPWRRTVGVFCFVGTECSTYNLVGCMCRYTFRKK